MRAFEIMATQPAVIGQSEPIARAAAVMAQLDVGALPVVDDYVNRRLVGIITDRDIVIRHEAKGGSKDCCVSDHMTQRDLEVVHPDADVHDVVGRMRRLQLRRLPVVDRDERIVGIISQGDVARHMAVREPVLVAEMVSEISTPHQLELQKHG